MKKKWIYKEEANAQWTNTLSSALSISETLSRLLAQRGIRDFDEAKLFFRPSTSEIHDPFLLKNMEQAVDRIETALGNGEHILVYGDYDVDGTTSVSMLFRFLKDYSNNISYYVPDRYSEGYGVSNKAIDHAIENEIGLIIALDCGTKAVEKIARAKQNGVDFIVCDHHLPGDELPDAILLNPKQEGCAYPFKELSGAGVGFKLLQAFSKKNDLPMEKVNNYLDLLVSSIGADMVPVTGENRVLAFYGLQKLNEAPCIGLKSIITHAEVNRKLNMTDIGFLIGPRINAAGRIDHANKAVKLLLSESFDEANHYCEEINLFNSERKILDTEISKEALAIILSSESMVEQKSTVIANPDWNKGVIGIVASKLQEEFYRPTIVLTKSGETYTGSARSVGDFDIHEAIGACSEILESYGGHKAAAGLTIKEENIGTFAMLFEEEVQNTIEEEDLIRKIYIDEIITLDEITPKFFRILEQFEPFGIGNEQPLFQIDNLYVLPGFRIVGRYHLKLDIVNEEKTIRFPAIAFKQAYIGQELDPKKPFSIVCSIEKNEWNGQVNLQLNIRDFKL